MKIECWSVVLESKSKKFFSNINVISWPTSRLKTPYNTENLSTLKTAKCSCLEILLAAPRVRVACGGGERLSRIMFSMLLWTCIPHTQSRITSSCSLSALGHKEYSLTAHVTNLLEIQSKHKQLHPKGASESLALQCYTKPDSKVNTIDSICWHLQVLWFIR